MLATDFTSFYLATPHTQAGLCFAFVGDDIILDAHLRLPTALQLAQMGAAFTDCQIGEVAGLPCRLMGWPAGSALPQGLRSRPLRQAWDVLDQSVYALAVRAKLLLSWDREHRFCGVCGTATQSLPHEPARVCPACQHRAYPRQSAAIMALVRKGDELLLARSPHFSPGTFSVLAGFVDAGETLEECVHREVMEEVGVRVTNLRWFGSRPWPFPHSLMLAFHADYVEGEITPQAGEIEEAGWFHINALPTIPHPASLAHSLILSALPQG